MTDLLYKYRPFDRDDSRTTDILTNHRLYFSSPFDFNDPFDCSIELSTDGTEEEWLNYIYKLVLKFNPHLSSNEQRLEAFRLYQDGFKGKIDQHISDVTSDISAGLAIYCLSALKDDILMWSHYAKNHTGIVLEFKAGPEDIFFRISQPVVYQDDYPQVRIIGSTDRERVVSSILTKSKHWQYEEEYRIIDYLRPPGFREFPPQLLSSVIMGCRMPEPQKEKIRDLIKNHPAKPKLYQASKAKRSFKLVIEEVL